jgi:hypothetical protein
MTTPHEETITPKLTRRALHNPATAETTLTPAQECSCGFIALLLVVLLMIGISYICEYQDARGGPPDPRTGRPVLDYNPPPPPQLEAAPTQEGA